VDIARGVLIGVLTVLAVGWLREKGVFDSLTTTPATDFPAAPDNSTADDDGSVTAQSEIESEGIYV